MNEVLKMMKQKFDELEIDYELVDNDMFVFDLNMSELGITPRYGINIIELESGYRIQLLCSSICKVENKESIYKLMNDINQSLAFSKFIIDKNNNIMIFMDSLSIKEDIVEDSFALLSLLNNQIEENFKKIMKENWAD